MTVDREAVSSDDRRTGDVRPGGGSGPGGDAGAGGGPNGSPPVAPVSRATLVGYSLAGVILISWFLFGWLVQQQGFVNSVGEAVGSAFALLLVISIIGTVRRARR